MHKRIVSASMLLLTLVGCATTDGYREFYTPVPDLTPEKVAQMRAAPLASTPQVTHLSGRFDQNAQREYMKEGYQVIGYSSFTSGHRQNDDDAVDQAKKIGADLVIILGSEYAGSVTTSVPLTTPTATTSYTNGMATAYGTGGSAVAYGNSTTTTYGTSTSYVPMTVNRYQFGALYLVKVRFHLGVRDRDLSDQERQELQTNRGVYVITVVDGTPAYASDILPGDIITALDGSRIDGLANFNELLSTRVGGTVELTIIRHGKMISKVVPLQQ
jgi:PDZ domain